MTQLKQMGKTGLWLKTKYITESNKKTDLKYRSINKNLGKVIWSKINNYRQQNHEITTIKNNQSMIKNKIHYLLCCEIHK